MVSITPSHIIEYLFCPRFIYFQYVLGIEQREEKSIKAIKGRNIHELKIIRNKDYLRKSIGVKDKILDVYLTSENLRGRVDEVLYLEDGSMAPLDYKFAKYKDVVYNTYKTQLVCYARLIEINYGAIVNRAYLVYVRSKNKLVKVDITLRAKESVDEYIAATTKIISDNLFPKATGYKSRCTGCTYRNICIK